ncbi:SAM-dependent methyltransferase [Shewanella sp. YIC-542]|uniref:SAM-dependent methyltransferase n=1 Tax=Shewanella mytili TaxID=3377111 RepID=UPI00398E9741
MGKGSLVCVGTGLQLAGQVTVMAKSHIEQAQQIFSLMPDGFSQRWLTTLNDHVVDLQQFYAKPGEVKNRRITYAQMVAAIMASVRAGKRVVGVFYGHPGVFACVPHMAIAQAREEGYRATMEPGISAEDCLWADLGIDPGNYGCQSLEASQLMFFAHQLDNVGYVLLWQIALAGEHTLTGFSTTAARLAILVKLLQKWYPLDHQVCLYEAANLPIGTCRAQWIGLEELPAATLNAITTLVIPPVRQLQYNLQVLQQLGLTPADLG